MIEAEIANQIGYFFLSSFLGILVLVVPLTLFQKWLKF